MPLRSPLSIRTLLPTACIFTGSLFTMPAKTHLLFFANYAPIFWLCLPERGLRMIIDAYWSSAARLACQSNNSKSG